MTEGNLDLFNVLYGRLTILSAQINHYLRRCQNLKASYKNYQERYRRLHLIQNQLLTDEGINSKTYQDYLRLNVGAYDDYVILYGWLLLIRDQLALMRKERLEVSEGLRALSARLMTGQVDYGQVQTLRQSLSKIDKNLDRIDRTCRQLQALIDELKELKETRPQSAFDFEKIFQEIVQSENLAF